MSTTGARGGRQRIPRPPNFVMGAPAPWADLDATGRVFPLARVRVALTDLPTPLREGAGPDGDPALLDPSIRASAVLVPLFEEDGEARVVLTRRPEHLPTHQGQIAFPGGKVDPAVDRDALDAALREAEEEIGLPRGAVEVIAELDHLPSVGGPFRIAPFVGLLAGRPTLVPAPGEVDRVFDVTLAELVEPGVHHEERWEFEGLVRAVHFFELADETVWGATARILASMLALIVGAPATVPENP